LNDQSAPAPGQVDLTNCDREPIHQLGSIQPIGFLIVMTADWIISNTSANLSEYLDTGQDGVIGRPAADLLSKHAIHTLRNRLAMLRGKDSLERVFGMALQANGSLFDVALHMAGSRIILEGEPTKDQDYGDATGTVRGMVSRLETAPDMTAFFNEGARQIRALIGFDRVMVYRFAPDGSGEVVAESAKSGIGSFLGLHYPATDIPRQARELYTRSLLRIIADIDARPVPIEPAGDEHGQPVDLSLSILRSVSPIHIEYLRNMGVRASMSISIVVEGQLWGLIACHHYSPRCPTFERRSVAELFAQMFAMRIESRERKEVVEYERRARDISDQLLGAVASDETLLNDPDWLSSILTSAIPADGVGVWINGNYAFSGLTPNTGEFARVIQALNTTAAGRAFATDHIRTLVPSMGEASSSKAAGLLAIPISRTPRDYVVLFRSEMVRSVRWAGDPHKPVEYGPNGPRLTPRESFAEWKETVAGRSLPFTASELRVAETLRATLIEVVLRLADEATAERREATNRQELLIAELNHRVRNILSLIRGLIRQSKPAEGTSVEDFVAVIDGRVHALARAHNQITDDHWGPAPVKNLLDAEAAAFLTTQKDHLVLQGPPVLLNPQAYSTLALVVHELVTNSVKYGSLSVDDGRAIASWTVDEAGNLLFCWREENGPEVWPPNRKGFGTTIIEHSVPYDLGGTSGIEYAREGVRANFMIPAKHVIQSAAISGTKISLPRPQEAEPIHVDELLRGKNVMLVEDSLIIALDAEDLLHRLGAASVTTESSAIGGIAAIEARRPDVAILDINLGDHDSVPIANRLSELGIPFLFATGYGEQSQLPDVHKARPIVQKPYTLGSLSRRMGELLGIDA
jgi:light-regulated signal transduction histidine kinase (bacteriophytochrome)